VTDNNDARWKPEINGTDKLCRSAGYINYPPTPPNMAEQRIPPSTATETRQLAGPFFNLVATWWVGYQRHASAALPPGKRPSTHGTADWVSLWTDQDESGKSHPHLGSNPRPYSR
jgi:hypothetical protein